MRISQHSWHREPVQTSFRPTCLPVDPRGLVHSATDSGTMSVEIERLRSELQSKDGEIEALLQSITYARLGDGVPFDEFE